MNTTITIPSELAYRLFDILAEVVTESRDAAIRCRKDDEPESAEECDSTADTALAILTILDEALK